MAWLARIAENEIRDQADYHGRQRRDAARRVSLEASPEAAALAARGPVADEPARARRAGARRSSARSRRSPPTTAR